MKRKKRLFYGWVIVAGCFLICTAAMGLVTNLSSVFVKPVSESLGIERSAFSFSATLVSLFQMAGAPIVGQLYLRVKKPKRLMVFGAMIVTLGLFGYSRVQTMGQFYICAIICGLFNSLVTGTGISMIISNWFEEKRGFAYGVALTGSGFAALVFTPVISKVVSSLGWRTGYVVCSLIYLVLTVPVLLFAINVTPEEKGLRALGIENKSIDVPVKTGITLKESAGTLEFWLLIVSSFLTGLCCMGTQQHIIAYCSDIGYSTATAASVFSVMMGIMIPGKILLGWILDKYGIPVALSYGFALIIISEIALLSAKSIVLLVIFVVCFGLANAMQTVPSPVLYGRYFGMKNYTAIIGFSHVGISLGIASGSYFSGLFYDKTGSYTTAWYIYIFIAIIGWVVQLYAYRHRIKKGPLY